MNNTRSKSKKVLTVFAEHAYIKLTCFTSVRILFWSVKLSAETGAGWVSLLNSVFVFFPFTDAKELTPNEKSFFSE